METRCDPGADLRAATALRDLTRSTTHLIDLMTRHGYDVPEPVFDDYECYPILLNRWPTVDVDEAAGAFCYWSWYVEDSAAIVWETEAAEAWLQRPLARVKAALTPPKLEPITLTRAWSERLRTAERARPPAADPEVG